MDTSQPLLYCWAFLTPQVTQELFSFLYPALHELISQFPPVSHSDTPALFSQVALHEVWPSPFVVLPSVHAMHSDWPGSLVYDPAGHGLQPGSSKVQYWPALH